MRYDLTLFNDVTQEYDDNPITWATDYQRAMDRARQIGADRRTVVVVTDEEGTILGQANPNGSYEDLADEG